MIRPETKAANLLVLESCPWDGDTKSEAAALGPLDMTGGVGLRLRDGVVNIGGSIADAVEGVFKDDDAEFVPRPASLDDAILFDLAMGLGRLRCSNLVYKAAFFVEP